MQLRALLGQASKKYRAEILSRLRTIDIPAIVIHNQCFDTKMSVNSVLKVTLLYLVLGLLWILLSDKALSLMVADDILAMKMVQSYKGCAYVLFTAVLLYVLVKRYNRELNDKIAKLLESREKLIASEENYRLLFETSPMPVMIYDPVTERILKVNRAALGYYGYSVDEFSHMSLLQIEEEAELDLSTLEEKLNIPKHDGMIHAHGIHRHRKKDGKLTYVFMQGSTITYRGVRAYIVMVTDITHQLRYIQTVEQQNEKLNRIAWMQSHVVRAPLASLMGLVHLLKDDSQDCHDLADKILNAADKLDEVIKDISSHTAGDIPKA